MPCYTVPYCSVPCCSYYAETILVFKCQRLYIIYHRRYTKYIQHIMLAYLRLYGATTPRWGLTRPVSSSSASTSSWMRPFGPGCLRPSLLSVRGFACLLVCFCCLRVRAHVCVCVLSFVVFWFVLVGLFGWLFVCEGQGRRIQFCVYDAQCCIATSIVAMYLHGTCSREW